MPTDDGSSAPLASGSGSGTQEMDRFWSQAATDAQPRISQIRRRLPHFPSAPLRIQRVSQLDAEVLDDELLSLLVQPLKTSLAQIKSTLPDRIEPELLALLKLVLFKYSVWDNGATYGAMLQNLRYRNEWAHRGGLQSSFVSASLSRLQLAIYPLLTVGVPYLYQRLERRMTSLSFSNIPSRDPRRLLWTLTDQLHRAYEAAALVNFAAFLADGRYRTLTDRILGMRLTYSERTLNRNVSFEFLNRQLVWHAFTEFLLFLLPIIRPKRLLKRMMRLPTHPRILAFWLAVLPKWLASRAGLSRDPHSGKPRYRLPIRVPFLTSSADSKGKASEGGKYASLPAGICAICWERIETEVAATSSSVSMGNVGIPSSDPLDPSSGAFAPSSTAASTASSTIRNSQYHNASRAFGVSQDGIPYANALTHTAYAAEPCGCEYCYFCLAEKLLSEEAGEELEDSKSASSGPPVATSQSHGTSRKGKKSSKGAPPKDVIVSHGVGAWDCLRCGHKVRGMRRVVAGEDEDDEGAKAADERLLEGPTQPNRTRPTPPTDQPRNASKSSMPATQSKVQTKEQSHVFGDTDEEELDLDELTSSST